MCRCSDQTIKAGGRKAAAEVNFVSSSDRKLPKLGSKTLEDGMTDSDPKNDCSGSVMKFCMSDLAVQLGQPAYAQLPPDLLVSYAKLSFLPFYTWNYQQNSNVCYRKL